MSSACRTSPRAKDAAKIKQITDAIEATPGATLLDVDPGRDTNRTVVTFVGSPEAAAEAAFQAIAKAAQVIDMSRHHGAHPRMGATDVCPFVPVEGVTLEDCAAIARSVGARVGKELEIPVYLYEAAAASPERRNLANIREGEYEGLARKLADPRWQPDYGPARFNPRTGATVIGARQFLIAYNITLNSRDKAAASDIAMELRENRPGGPHGKTGSPYYSRGDILFYREGRFPCGNCDFAGSTFDQVERHCREEHGYELRQLAACAIGDFSNVVGQKVRRAGKFRCCKAIGWYVDQYKRAQISINLTNYLVTPPHLVLEEARRLAADRGLVVTGSEVRRHGSLSGDAGSGNILSCPPGWLAGGSGGGHFGGGRLLDGLGRRAAVRDRAESHRPAGAEPFVPGSDADGRFCRRGVARHARPGRRLDRRVGWLAGSGPQLDGGQPHPPQSRDCGPSRGRRPRRARDHLAAVAAKAQAVKDRVARRRG